MSQEIQSAICLEVIQKDYNIRATLQQLRQELMENSHLAKPRTSDTESPDSGPFTNIKTEFADAFTKLATRIEEYCSSNFRRFSNECIELLKQTLSAELTVNISSLRHRIEEILRASACPAPLVLFLSSEEFKLYAELCVDGFVPPASVEIHEDSRLSVGDILLRSDTGEIYSSAPVYLNELVKHSNEIQAGLNE